MRKIPLSQLGINHRGSVCEIGCGEPLASRLSDMGICTEDEITPLYRSPFGSPTAYYIKDCIIALRKRDARNISVLTEQNSDE